MQANRSLSSEQFAVLQTIVVFLESVSITLDSQTRATTPTDIELTGTVRDLGLYCKDRLLAVFPDIQIWRSLGDGTGSVQ